MAFQGTGRATIAALSRSLLFFSRTSIHSPPISTNTFSSSSSSAAAHPSLKNSSNFDATKRLFSSKTNTKDTKLNFSLSDSDSDGDDDNNVGATTPPTENKDRKLPPPYDPFGKKPAIQEPKDPKDLQEIFHNMRSGDGLLNHAVKMFDALSKEGLTHVALELFGEIKDKGHVPDVVAHTAIVEAYVNAGQPKEALKAHMRMLASGVSPNAYSYAVLIRGLAAGDAKFLRDAKRFVLEMMDKGMRPNAETYTAVFEGLIREEKADEAAELLGEMKGKGFVPDEKAVREVMGNKRGPVFRNVMNILFGK